MALNFPDNPQTGDTYLAPNNQTYLYDGEKWIGFVTPAGTIAQGITFVGDDSTGTRISDNETIKIAGAGSVTTSVSGDTITITGSASAQGITFVGDDSTGTRVSDGESFKIAGSGSITTAVSGDTLTITGSASAQGITFVGDDSTGTRVSDGESFKIAGGTGLTSVVSGDTITLDIDSTVATLTGSQELTNKTLTTPKIDLIKDANGNEVLGFSTTASATDYLVVKNGIGVGSPIHIYAEGDSANIGVHLQPKGSGIFTISDGTDFNKGIRFRSSSSAASAITLIDAVSSAGRVVTLPDATDTLVGRATSDTLTNKSISLTTNTITGTVITMVGDDSSGTAVNIGETFKIAGTQNISTAVSGDTLTITGPNLSSYLTNSTLTVVGDDSTGVTLNSGETIKIAGSGSITTAVSGDTITITGSASAQGITFVGDDSSGTRVSDGESFKIAGTQNITTAVSGDTLTITGPDLSSYLTAVPKTIDVNEISSGDSSAIQINDAVNISGAVTANAGLTINNNSNTWSFVSDGTLTLPAESGQIGRNGYPNGIDLYNNNGGTGYVRMNYADESVIWADAGGAHIQTTGGTWDFGTDGTLTFPDETTQNTAASITIVGDDSTGVTLNAGETIKIAGAGSITTAVSGDTITITGTGGGASIGDLTVDGTTISSGSSSKITLNESVDITGTLQVNDINSADSSAIQINDGVNVSGDLNVSGSINKVTITAPAAGSTLTIANGKTLTASNSLTFTGTDATSFAFPGTSGTVVTLAATQSLTNKTLTLPVIDNIKHGYSTTATAAGTTILTSTSNYMQFFTGSTTQILSLPAPQTMTLGQGFLIVNNSTGSVEVRAANSATVITVLPGTAASCISIDLTAGNGAAGWNAEFVGFSSVTGTGANVLAVSPTITGTLTANTFVTNDISSADSSAIQINDSLNASGTITATTFVTHGTGGSITGVNTLQVNEISSADSTAIQINDAVNISGTLNAKTLITNTISSEDSSAIQINDGLRISGDLTFSNNTVQTTAYVTASGNWTVTTGTNTYSFTVPVDGTYTMWVKGNIANGIIIWNATVSVSNSNVAAIGYQYAWNYTGGGSPISLTAIPDQIRGSAGTISTDATYAGTTSNRFDFGISNTSGSSQTIYYGYAKIS